MTRATSILPDRVERALGLLVLILLAAVVAAVLRGRPQWAQVPLVVWLHLATVVVALGVTPVLLWQRRGTRRHRVLGYVWAGAMLASAMDSLAVRQIGNGAFSPIHLLSAFVIVTVPLLVLAARRHEVSRHRRTARGLVIGALLIAGFFTFPFERLLGHWLLG
ncbi:DUF2306 domain-containing protein [Novosphingobium sp.]|uniref:DUF2306 domain-containing protein n=1 Tax=Novosphingobium sp. TaxID=1874826 RepID=UPI0038BA775C